MVGRRRKLGGGGVEGRNLDKCAKQRREGIGIKKWGGEEENRDLLMSKEKGEEGGKRKGCWTTTRGNGNIFP